MKEFFSRLLMAVAVSFFGVACGAKVPLGGIIDNGQKPEEPGSTEPSKKNDEGPIDSESPGPVPALKEGEPLFNRRFEIAMISDFERIEAQSSETKEVFVQKSTSQSIEFDLVSESVLTCVSGVKKSANSMQYCLDSSTQAHVKVTNSEIVRISHGQSSDAIKKMIDTLKVSESY